MMAKKQPAKPKRMKTVENWALVDDRGNLLFACRTRPWVGNGERLCRVSIREVPPARKKGKR